VEDTFSLRLEIGAYPSGFSKVIGDKLLEQADTFEPKDRKDYGNAANPLYHQA
jgi:hypothetical protein